MVVTDQIGHQFKLDWVPQRIISVVPSQTELLYDLGLDDRVVGITKFCIHPTEWFKKKSRVGGTKSLNIEKIEELNPDLIIANKEENTQEQIEYLQTKYLVYTSDISNLDQSLKMIKVVGEMTNTSEKSLIIQKRIINEFNRLSSLIKKNYSALYFIWREPFMTINQNTFINDMMMRCGFNNMISDELDYPTLSEQYIATINPDLIFLSSEPFPFKEKHLEEFQRISPNSKIVLVEGEYFSWYGSRLQHAVDYFIALMNKIP